MSAIEKLGLALSVGLLCPAENVSREQPQGTASGMATEICTHFARNEAAPSIAAWPQEIRQRILAIRRHCAYLSQDSDMDPLATSEDVLKGVSNLLKETAEEQADDYLPKNTRVPDPVR